MKKLLLLTLLFTALLSPAQALPSLSAPTPKIIEQPTPPNSFLHPIKKQLVQWNILINREIPKRMKNLKDNPSPLIILTSLLAALAYGILHTLGPGHGKMVVATYFLTHGAHFWRGTLVGIQVAFSHVAGAVFIVLATDIAMRQLLTDPQDQVFWVRTISYGLIMLIGFYMLTQAMRHARGSATAHTCGHCSHGHDKTHTHGQPTRREAILAWCIGAIPCTGSLLILLYAMAHDMLFMGLAMVFFIAVGMALMMTLIGWLCILGKQKLIDRTLNRKNHAHRWKIAIEIIGALAIMALGALLLATVLL